MASKQRIAIIGAGSFGREVFHLLNDDLLNTMEMSKENNENYAEEENNGENQIDEKWKNWDDGD